MKKSSTSRTIHLYPCLALRIAYVSSYCDIIYRWLQLSLAAWRKETNILIFICLVKHFIRDYEIITYLGQEGVGLESGPSSFACTYYLEPKLPSFACCLFTMKNEMVTFLLVTFTCNGYTHQKQWCKEIFMFVFKNGHRGAILEWRKEGRVADERTTDVPSYNIF